MRTTAEIIAALREYKTHSTEKYGIVTLGIFGSVARGEQHEGSDLDVFIKLKKTSYYTLMNIKEELTYLHYMTPLSTLLPILKRINMTFFFR